MNELHILEVNDTLAQGVEFDIVCLLNPRELLEPVTKSFPTELAEQVQQVQKDLLYVALTRAMNELHILEVNDTLPTDTTQKQ
jgi:superfamily I DNA/RNA helicase